MLRPQPPTTRTSAPGDSARNGVTARHASGRLSLALATAVGGTPPPPGFDQPNRPTPPPVSATSPAPLRGARLALAAEEGSHPARAPPIDEEVHAPAAARLDGAELLELAAWPGGEASARGGEAVRGGSVVADVEVEVAERAYRAPVA